jgi:hypothetical protein
VYGLSDERMATLIDHIANRNSLRSDEAPLPVAAAAWAAALLRADSNLPVPIATMQAESLGEVSGLGQGLVGLQQYWLNVTAQLAMEEIRRELTPMRRKALAAFLSSLQRELGAALAQWNREASEE